MEATAVRVELRCHSCSHRIGTAEAAVRLVALFKASLFGRVPAAHTGEVRKRCQSCGWVNVFHPAVPERDWRSAEVKSA